MSTRRRYVVRISVATLVAFLASLLSPRAGLIVHRHAGGDHAHVHLDQPPGEAHHHHHRDDHTDDDHRGLEHPHHHDSADHDHDHHGATPPGADAAASSARPIVVAADRHRAGLHFHTQHPYLLYLASVISGQTILTSLPQFHAKQPPAPLSASLALPFARGPPSLSALPTLNSSHSESTRPGA